MKKILSFVLLSTLIAALLSGCAKPPVQPANPTPTPTPAQQSQQKNPQPSPPASKIAANGVDIQGKFNGRIDENSVEIEVNPEDIQAYRVTDVQDQLKDINDGDKVKFSYQANEYGQLNITKIEKIK